jgi:hypothetical protein
MHATSPSQRAIVLVVTLLCLGACGTEPSARMDEINDFGPSTAGRLEGVVSRANGAPAQVRMSRNLNALVVTTVELRAEF